MAVRQMAPLLAAQLNKVDAPSRIIAHIVPIRVLRIVDVKDDGLTFRLEQFIFTTAPNHPQPQGIWKTLSTHGGQRSGEALGPAFSAGVDAQKALVAKLKRNRPGLVGP